MYIFGNCNMQRYFIIIINNSIGIVNKNNNVSNINENNNISNINKLICKY